MALGRMITGFIGVIVGASLVPTLVTIVNSTTSQLANDTQVSGADTGLTLTNASATSLAAKSTYPLATCSDLALINSTGGESISSGNYTFTESDCSFILGDSSQYIGQEGNGTYNYQTNALDGTPGSAASLLELTILFFALSVMIAGVGTSISGLVEYGLL